MNFEEDWKSCFPEDDYFVAIFPETPFDTTWGFEF